VDPATLVPGRTIGIATGAPMAVAFHPVSHDGYVISRTLGGNRTPPSGLSAVPWLDPTAEGESWLTVYDPGFQVVRWRVALPGAGAHAAAFSKDGAELYVSLRGADKLAVVDTSRRAVSRKLDTGAGPSGVLSLGDGSLAVACFNAHPGQVQVLDARTGAARKAIEVPDSPLDLAAGGGKLYVAAAGANEVAEVDLGKGEVTRRFKAGAAPVAVAVVP
jgi:YVTN family beta-propeller protein